MASNNSFGDLTSTSTLEEMSEYSIKYGQKEDALPSAPGMVKLGSTIQFLENNTILVTGATGFLAKIMVEKILRVQPNVKKLFLLLRATDDKAAALRLKNEIQMPLLIDRVNFEIESGERECNLFLVAELKYGEKMSLHSQLDKAEKDLAEYRMTGESLLREEVTDVDIAKIVSNGPEYPY